MNYPRVVASVGLMAALVVAAPYSASAQGRNRGHAAPRGSVRSSRPPIRVVPYRNNVPYRNYYYRGYRPHVNLGFFYGYPGYYGSYAYGNPYGYGYAPFGYGYDYGYRYAPPYGYGFSGYAGRPYGGVRIDLPQRDAEVLVDGYFVGIVDDFDGVLQQANVEAGPHRIEIRAPGFEPVSFDVNVEPGRTITYRSSMRPLEP
jgi:hypothetical protein